MPNGAPKDLTQCRRFFLEPLLPKQRMYEALRAYFLDDRPSQEVAKTFGYTPDSFRVLCHHFRRDDDPQFFLSTHPGPKFQPQKSVARERILALRKQNHSVYEISETLREEGIRLSPTAVREVLRQEGFASLPRRLDEERPTKPHPTVEPIANLADFSLAPRRFATRCGGLFLFLPALLKLQAEKLAIEAHLPGSQMIPAPHALRACLALKLWSLERKSHVMALVADEGLALFCGLNVIPKKSYLSEYSHRIDSKQTQQILATWHTLVNGEPLFVGDSFNLDFHSVPYYGEHPGVQRHYVSARSRRQPSVLVFLAQDAGSRAFCYANANLRKGEEAGEIFSFLSFWKKSHGKLPRHVVFDSQLTTHANLAKLDKMGVTFITLRRRAPKLLQEIANLPRSAWRTIEIDAPARKFRTPRVYEQTVTLAGRSFRQLYLRDLGHEEPTLLLTNDRQTALPKLVARYAQRMLIENALSDAVRFFHMDALSSAVALKVDFDMALLVIASGLYRLFAAQMRGYADAQARQIFRDLIDMPADIVISKDQVLVQFHRRAHLPILMASGLLDQTVQVPWWNNLPLRFAT